jgi:hypothetical protein
MPPAVKRPEVKPEEEEKKRIPKLQLASRMPPNIQTTSHAKLGCRKYVAAERKKKKEPASCIAQESTLRTRRCKCSCL